MTAALIDRSMVSAQRTCQPGWLRVERTDIQFCNVTPELLRVSVTVHNDGPGPATPGTIQLQAAPLGAFVPWKPLTTVAVPEIEPYQSVEVATEVPVPRPQTGGSRRPPGTPAVALALDDDGSQTDSGFGSAMTALLGKLFRPLKRPATLPGSPRDLFELFTSRQTHWVGNINVLIGNKAVERHMAQALRIWPGQMNIAMLIVGSRRDTYQFDLSGTGASWDAALFRMHGMFGLASAKRADQLLPLSQWVKISGHETILLALCPPKHCDGGSVDVHVRRRSTGEEAVVEFSLDPRAAGPGCYTV